MWGKPIMSRRCGHLTHTARAALVKSGYGLPVKRLVDELLPLCPSHTLWHWALRSWRHLSVAHKVSAGSSSGRPVSTTPVRLRPGTFPEIKDWGYAGAVELAKLSIAKGMQSPSCYKCAHPVSRVFLCQRVSVYYIAVSIACTTCPNLL